MTTTHKRPAKRGFNTPKPQPTELRSSSPPQTSSWQLLKTNFAIIKHHIASVALVVIVPNLLLHLGLTMSGYGTRSDGLAAVGYFIGAAAGIWVFVNSLVIIYYQLRIVGGNPPSLRHMYSRGLRYVPRLFAVAAIIAIAVIIRLPLLIKPGVRAFRQYILAPYFLIDEDLGVREAMDRSRAASDQHVRAVWSTALIVMAIAIAAYLISTYVPAYGPAIASLVSVTYLFLPALRYQELTSDVRNGELALRKDSQDQPR